MAKKKFRLKSFKEINEDLQDGFKKFTQDVGKFFGVTSEEEKLQKEIDEAPHNSKETAIDITPDEIWSIVEKNKEVTHELANVKDKTQKKTLADKWEENWNNFAEKTMNTFTDLKEQIEDVNKKNMELIEEKIKIGKANYKIFLRKQEIKNAERKEQQKIALQRFQEQANEWGNKNKEFFDNLQSGVKDQLEQWHEDQKKLRETNIKKWEENQKKFKEDYYEWINNRRKRAIEKSKYKLQLG